MGHAVQAKVNGLTSWRNAALLRSVARDLATFRQGSGAFNMVKNEQPELEEIPLQQ